MKHRVSKTNTAAKRRSKRRGFVELAIASKDYGLAEANLIRLLKHIEVDRGQGVLSPPAAARLRQIARIELEHVRIHRLGQQGTPYTSRPNKLFTHVPGNGNLDQSCQRSKCKSDYKSDRASGSASIGSTSTSMANYRVSHRVLKLDPFTSQTNWVNLFGKRECLEVYIDGKGQDSRRLVWFAKEVRRLLVRFPWLDDPVVLGQVHKMARKHESFAAECYGAQIAITSKTFDSYSDHQNRAERVQLDTDASEFRFRSRDR